MPPFVARKRRLSTPPPESPTPKKAKKPTLFDAVDSPAEKLNAQENKNFLDSLHDSESSPSDASGLVLEDVPLEGGQKDSDDEEDWEDALKPDVKEPTEAFPEPTGDLELTLHKHQFEVPLEGKRKGPTKIERQIRMNTHCMHVQSLMFHNAIRNGWACDSEVQKILLRQLPGTIQQEISTWRRNTGHKAEQNGTSQIPRKDSKGKKSKKADPRKQRDWGPPAERQEEGAANMSHGDPIYPLLQRLAAYWRKRFTVTAPGLRKQGYKSIRALEEEVTSFRNDEHDPEEHGERIRGIKQFRKCAEKYQGSRDVGAQLFTALLRGIGIETRLIASLQPIGFGWSKSEDSPQKKKQKNAPAPKAKTSETADSSSSSEFEKKSERKSKYFRSNPKSGDKAAPIVLSDTSDLSEAPSPESDIESVIGLSLSPPPPKSSKKYDRDLAFPNYWAEVISPITNKVHAVDPIVLNPPVVMKQEDFFAFEPRGAKAEKARQVFAYMIAYSADGTAKEVTTRYLKRNMWPGKTKGVRMPVEKIPVYNKRGKVKRYEEYDWFKTVMSGYARHTKRRTLADDIEDATDLKPAKIEKKATTDGEETLQGYKQSAEFVLERHLRREEAIVPGAKPVKTFKSGKGDNVKEEPVYFRKDIVACKTVESWHKEGRNVKATELRKPMKMVPARHVTLTKQRELEEATRQQQGVKPMQGLFSKRQTEYIIPPPIENGVIPKNEYGNMDCFVPSMVPRGAVHVPLRGTVRACKRLGIDYAEAVTGFEFGNKRAVPVCEGVIVAAENERALMEAWEEEEAARRVREDEKRRKLVLGTWRKFLMGLRIVERVRDEYGEDVDGHVKDEINPFTNPKQASKKGQDTGGGGFIVDDEDVEEEGLEITHPEQAEAAESAHSADDGDESSTLSEVSSADAE